MDLLQKIVARAKSDKQRIVLPEATEDAAMKVRTNLAEYLEKGLVK